MDNPSVLGIHLTQVGPIACGWAASESLRRSPEARLLAHKALPLRPAERSTQTRPLLLRGFGSQWRLLIARFKRPRFSPVSGAHHHMLGLPESDGYPVPEITLLTTVLLPVAQVVISESTVTQARHINPPSVKLNSSLCRASRGCKRDELTRCETICECRLESAARA